VGRASHRRTILGTIHTRDSQDGLEHTSETLTGEETSRDGEHVHVERLGVALEPDVGEHGASSHGEGVVRHGHDEAETDSVPVGNPVPVLAGDEEVLDDNRDDSDDAESERAVSGGLGDGWKRGEPKSERSNNKERSETYEVDQR